MNYNNQNKILPFYGSTVSPMFNNQISGYLNKNHNKIILKKDNKLNNNKAGALANNQKSNLETKLSNLSKFSNKIDSNLSLKLATHSSEVLVNNRQSVITIPQLILNVKNKTFSIIGSEENPNNVNSNSIKNLSSKLTAVKGKTYYTKIDMLTHVKSHRGLNQIQVNSKNASVANPNLNLNKTDITKNQGHDQTLFNEPQGYLNEVKRTELTPDIQVSKLLRSFYTIDSNIATSQYLVYNFNNNNKKIIKNLASILNNAFYSMSSVISKPVLNITPNKIVVHLFYYLTKNYKKFIYRKYRKSNTYKNFSNSKKFLLQKFVFKKFLSYNNNKFKLLCMKLSKILQKPVELDLVRIHYRYNESQILAKTLGLLGDKFIRPFSFFTYNTFSYAGILDSKKSKVNNINPIIPTFITGISIRLAGRLSYQKTIPKKTVKTIQRGTMVRTNAQIITTSRFTKKNRKGIFSVTVSMGHRFF